MLKFIRNNNMEKLLSQCFKVFVALLKNDKR